jgi:hypothetical protein
VFPWNIPRPERSMAIRWHKPTVTLRCGAWLISQSNTLVTYASYKAWSFRLSSPQLLRESPLVADLSLLECRHRTFRLLAALGSRPCKTLEPLPASLYHRRLTELTARHTDVTPCLIDPQLTSRNKVPCRATLITLALLVFRFANQTNLTSV